MNPTLQIKPRYSGGEVMPAVGTPEYVKAQQLASQSFGISLPSTPTPNKAGSGVTTVTKPQGTDWKSLISTSVPAVNAAEIEAQTRAQLGGGRSVIESQYGQKIAATKEEAQQQNRALEGQLGTSRRFSSSAQAFLSFIDDKYKKEVADLEVQRDTAVTNFDFKLASLINERIDNARAQNQKDFENMFKLIEFEEKQKKAEAERFAPQIKTSREAAVVDIFSQGITDPAQIFNLVNFNEDGELVGDITTEEIDGILERILPENKVKANLGTDYNLFEFAKSEGWLPADATIFDYWGAEKKAKNTSTVVGGSPNFDEFSREQVAFSLLPTQLRNSDAERAYWLGGIRSGLAAGKTPYEVADVLTGYMITNKDAFSDEMRKYISLSELQPGNEISNVARLINAGEKAKAIQLVENSIYNKAKKLDPDNFTSEEAAIYTIKQVEEIEKLLGEGWTDNIGPFEGLAFNKALKKLRPQDATDLLSKITQLTAKFQKNQAGTSMTENEYDRIIAPVVPDVTDKAGAFRQKLANLKSNAIRQLNATRLTYELPQINEAQLLDKSLRVPLYSRTSVLPSKDDLLNNPVPTSAGSSTSEYDPNVWSQYNYGKTSRNN